MSDLIKRSDAIKVVSHVAMECIDRKTRIELINAIPSADSTEYKRGKEDEKRWWSEHCAKCTDADRPQGEWIDKGKNLWKCSNCGMVIYSESEQDRNEFHKWCGRCGCAMKGADDE